VALYLHSILVGISIEFPWSDWALECALRIVVVFPVSKVDDDHIDAFGDTSHQEVTQFSLVLSIGLAHQYGSECTGVNGTEVLCILVVSDG